MNRHLLIVVWLLTTFPSFTIFAGGMDDDPTLFTVVVDQFEWRDADESGLLSWNVYGWIGKDLNKFWWKSEGEAEAGNADNAELQFLYSRAISTFWDFQVGWRSDFEPKPSRNWVAIGVMGLAPYFFDVDAAVFIGQSGHLAARVEAEYELLFTQRLILSPELEVNAYSTDDPQQQLGSGLSDLELGLRLRYEIRREFAPYMGINWEKKFGQTADYAHDQGNSSSDWQWVIGIRVWF